MEETNIEQALPVKETEAELEVLEGATPAPVETTETPIEEPKSE